jgi:hypothetical protein
MAREPAKTQVSHDTRRIGRMKREEKGGKEVERKS